MQFRNITKIERAKKLMERYNDVVAVSKYYKNSQNSSFYNRNRIGIFPLICIICEKYQYYTEKHTGKQKREKLSLCQTFTANKALLGAASRNKLFGQTLNIDCLANKVKYHLNCYKSYTRVPDSHPSDAAYLMQLHILHLVQLLKRKW